MEERFHVKSAKRFQLSTELGIQPSQIHQWVATALAQAERASQGKSGLKGKSSQPRLEKAKDRQIKRLKEKLQLKKEIISELMEENVEAKKPMVSKKLSSPRHTRLDRRQFEVLA